MEIGNTLMHKVDMFVFFKQGFLIQTHFLIFLDQQNTHQPRDLRSLIST